jgi:hypothetical protein
MAVLRNGDIAIWQYGEAPAVQERKPTDMAMAEIVGVWSWLRRSSIC